MHDDITDIPGIRVGHVTDLAAATGCTVILCDHPAIGGVDVRGGAPATRETDLLHPSRLIDEVHALVLTGGSAFGLDAASGVMRYLAEQQIGYNVGAARVPIVPAAAIFDLSIGSANVYPDADAGYHACLEANSGPIAQGNVGGGTGATVAKLVSPFLARKGGLGSASAQMADGTLVGAIVVVNALGNIFDPETQQMIAGTRSLLENEISATSKNPFGNTTIAAIATNASLNKEEINKVAQMAHDGFAQAIRPAHTMFDGDAIFALALGSRQQARPDAFTAAQRTSLIGATAASVLARAIIKAIRAAEPLHNVPAAQP